MPSFQSPYAARCKTTHFFQAGTKNRSLRSTCSRLHHCEQRRRPCNARNFSAFFSSMSIPPSFSSSVHMHQQRWESFLPQFRFSHCGSNGTQGPSEIYYSISSLIKYKAVGFNWKMPLRERAAAPWHKAFRYHAIFVEAGPIP